MAVAEPEKSAIQLPVSDRGIGNSMNLKSWLTKINCLPLSNPEPGTRNPKPGTRNTKR